MSEIRSQRHAIAARDAAAARLRRLTAAALAAATAVGGLVAGVAASATHPRAVVRSASPKTVAAGIPPVPAPAPTTPVANVDQAGSSAPASAPSSSAAPPVVVSGGS
jgi:hypothetical protein